MPTDHEVFVWVRGWEDIFTAAGRTREDCWEWLKSRASRGLINIGSARLEAFLGIRI
jgi:hypothetical protein